MVKGEVKGERNSRQLIFLIWVQNKDLITKYFYIHTYIHIYMCVCGYIHIHLHLQLKEKKYFFFPGILSRSSKHS